MSNSPTTCKIPLSVLPQLNKTKGKKKNMMVCPCTKTNKNMNMQWTQAFTNKSILVLVPTLSMCQQCYTKLKYTGTWTYYSQCKASASVSEVGCTNIDWLATLDISLSVQNIMCQEPDSLTWRVCNLQTKACPCKASVPVEGFADIDGLVTCGH